MTRDDLQRRILESVNDDPDDPVFFTQAQLNTLTDEASEVLAEDCQIIKRQALLALKQGVGFIYTPTISPDFMAPLRVWNHANQMRLTCLSMVEMDAINIRWQETTGMPEVWFPVSWDMIGIYPRPSSAEGVLRIDYLAWPRALLDAEDRPEMPEATHDALVLWGQYMGCLKKWDGEAAKIPLKALQLHKSVAQARSGLSRISVRSFQRSNVAGSTASPSNYQTGV